MAVNHADGTMFASVAFYPIAAGVGAGSAGARWLVPLFVVAGFAIGMGIICLGRKVIYGLVGFGIRRAESISINWLQQVAAAPFLILYLILPSAIAAAGVFGVWSGSVWLVGHFL